MLENNENKYCHGYITFESFYHVIKKRVMYFF